MPKAQARKREFEKTENGAPTSTALGEVVAICGPPDPGLYNWQLIFYGAEILYAI